MYDIRGGIELPMPVDVPGVDTDEGYDEAEETLDDLSLETDEVYDDSLASEGIEVEDDDF
jgi:hypothetical protein